MDRIKINGKNYNLVRGKAARVYFSKKPQQPGKHFRFWRLEAGIEKSSWYTLEELPRIQEAARRINESAERVGLRFALPTNEEREALFAWREFKKEHQNSRGIVQILSDALRREREKFSTPTIDEALRAFLVAKSANSTASARYTRTLKQQLEFFAEAFAGKRVSEISIADAESAVAQKKEASQKTRRHYLAAIRELFSWTFKRLNSGKSAVEKISNPLENLELPIVAKLSEPEILTVEQGRAFFDAIGPISEQAEIIFALCAFCGLRPAEALRLKWSDIHKDEIFLSCAITKTKVSRVIPIPENFRSWTDCKACGNSEQLIFQNRGNGEQSNMSKLAKAKRIAEKQIGFKIPRNALRHTAVSALSRIHGNARAADWCGHDVRTQGVFYRAAMSIDDATAWMSIRKKI